MAGSELRRQPRRRQFTNPAAGTTAAAQRTLYVNGIDLNGQHYGSGVSTLTSSTAALFTITTTH